MKVEIEKSNHNHTQNPKKKPKRKTSERKINKQCTHPEKNAIAANVAYNAEFAFALVEASN